MTGRRPGPEGTVEAGYRCRSVPILRLLEIDDFTDERLMLLRPD